MPGEQNHASPQRVHAPFKLDGRIKNPDPQARAQVERYRVDRLPFWERVFRDEHTALIERAYDARLRSGWRLTRLLAVVQGRIVNAQPLSTLLGEEAAIPRTMIPNGISRAEALGKVALPLVPPQPSQFLDNAGNEKRFVVYKKFVAALEKIALPILNMSVSCPNDPLGGVETLWGLLEERYCYKAYPSFGAIVDFEDYVAHETMEYLVRKNYKFAYQKLRYKYGLTRMEIESLIMVARGEARKIVEYDQEEQRAIMILKLEDHQRRAKLSFNHREELQSMKQQALVAGLTKTQPSGFDDMFARVVENNAKQRGDLAVTGHTVPKQLGTGTDELDPEIENTDLIDSEEE